MPKTPKGKREFEKEKSGERDKACDDALEKDQKERRYYYDDAHGYEVYKPDDDEKTED